MLSGLCSQRNRSDAKKNLLVNGDGAGLFLFESVFLALY